MSEEAAKVLAEHDKITTLTDLKYSEQLRAWRAPNSDLAPYLKDWQSWQQRQQRFTMMAVSDNGKNLWKQLVHCRQHMIVNISQLVLETSRLNEDIYRAHITTPNSKLSQAAQAWETQFEEIAKRASQFFSRKMQGTMVQEQRALIDKINQRINTIAGNCFFTDFIENGKKSGKPAAAGAKTSNLNLLTENEIRIQVLH